MESIFYFSNIFVAPIYRCDGYKSFCLDCLFIHLPCWHSNFYKILGICLPNVYSSQEKLINTNKHEGGKNILIISN